MASLSLPRVLQLKKNSLDAEREQFEKFQTLAIQKAINSQETPVKEKHVRSTIIGTFQEQSAITYWMVAIRLPLQDNRIVAWKFCNVTHKVLREGHPASLDDSQRHIGMIENLGKLWVHLREGYGRLVHLYCGLLVTKLKFHARNPRFPGNMQLTGDELDNIAENDVNNYFQLCVELFDYMDDILNLQAAVFDSLGNARANSMTASGQCRLAALIPCAQDSSHIYDCNVRLLFRLHAALPPDTLAGHRERFRQQFKKLSSFYKHASSLQYFRNLLTLPVLPSNPPNFLLQSDFGTYVAPVVSIPEPQPDDLDTVGSLIDTSDTISQATTPDSFDTMDSPHRASPSPQPDPLLERDRLIDHLQNELKRMRSEVSQLVQERNTMLSSMREHCTRIEGQLNETKTELEEERQKAELLSIQTPEIKQKLTETEERAKVQDEKFQKLKGAYTQLREEHIALIRQKAEVDKMAASLRSAAAQHESAKSALQQQLNDKLKDVELLQQSASTSEEIEAYKSEIFNLRTEIEQARQKEVELETLRASIEQLQIEHKTATTEQEDKVTTISNELKEVTENYDRIKQEKEDRDVELSRVKEELVGLREKSGSEYKKALEDKDAALKEVTELKLQYQQEKEEQLLCINNLKADLVLLDQKLVDKDTNFTKQCDELRAELMVKISELDEVIDDKECKIMEALEKIEILQKDIESEKLKYTDEINQKDSEIAKLQTEFRELYQSNENNKVELNETKMEKDEILIKLDKVIQEKESIDINLGNKDSEITQLELKIQALTIEESDQHAAILLVEATKNEEICQLKDVIEEKVETIKFMQETIDALTKDFEKQKSESETLNKTVLNLKTQIEEKVSEINELNSKLHETATNLESKLIDFSDVQKESDIKIAKLTEQLQSVTNCNDETIQNLKRLIGEKDNQVIAFNMEVNNLNETVEKLRDDLKEANAEMEIGKNELLSLREEHDNIVHRNEDNLTLKNKELTTLNEEIAKLHTEHTIIVAEKEKIFNEISLEKQELNRKILQLEEASISAVEKYNKICKEKDESVEKLTMELSELRIKLNNNKELHNKEIECYKEVCHQIEIEHNERLSKKDELISQAETDIVSLKAEVDAIKAEKEKEKQDMCNSISQKEKEMEILEARLQHTDSERLNAECELQDLLQHNTVLETDLAAARKQLEDARRQIELQNTKIVTSASEAALEVTNSALVALERGNAQETSKTAAETAAKALIDLARHKEMKGNEDSVARSAISAAHNAAALAAYVTDVCNLSTDMDLADKLSTECRTMLTSTQQCMESLKIGCLPSSALEAQVLVKRVAGDAAAADRGSGGERNVDDELADMDSAIEQAASQIEELLAASRAGDSGVKLEVNGKILDACTTLMGAVKILVQDARKLQNELGDPKTRQKMYRKNPQWSEGLISAAKAVVFAAKLLVTSADEAVGATGRVEGVSAAAHEVAGSTAQLVAASRARAPPAAPALAALTRASRAVAAATGAVVAAVRAAAALVHEQEALDTSSLTLTATRRLEMESKVRSLELETALEAERVRLAALRKRHYQLAQLEENGSITNGK